MKNGVKNIQPAGYNTLRTVHNVMRRYVYGVDRVTVFKSESGLGVRNVFYIFLIATAIISVLLSNTVPGPSEDLKIRVCQ